jgi:GTPase SAR1 family protein
MIINYPGPCLENSTSSLNSDVFIKSVLVGDTAVGKTSFLHRFTDDTFSDNYIATIGVDFRFKQFEVQSKEVKMQIWDTAGQERYRSLCNIYYKGADLIILMFDLANKVNSPEIIRVDGGRLAAGGIHLLFGKRNQAPDPRVN